MPAPSEAIVLGALRRREMGLYVRAAGMFLLGVPMSLVGGLMLGSMFWFTALMFGYWRPWWWFFAGLTGITVPLLYWTELRQGRELLGEAVRGGNARASNACWALRRVAGSEVAMLGALVTNPRATAAGFVEVFLFGPRMVVGALRQLRAALALRGVDRGRAAEVLRVLIIEPRGCALGKVLRPGETVAGIVGPLGYLAYHEWIGLSENCDRGWCLSETREGFGMGVGIKS